MRGVRVRGLVGACLLFIACADGTEIRVRLLADDGLRERVHSLQLTVRGQDEVLTERTVIVGVDGTFPFEVPVVPRAGDTTRTFDLSAEIFDDSGDSLGVQRLRSTFAAQEQRIVELRFAESCIDTRCSSSRTCQEGTCVDACVAVEGRGCEAVSACDEAGFIGENFETTDAWPSCPDFSGAEVGSCVRASTGSSVSVVDALGPDGPGAAPPCGGKVLRLENGGQATSEAFLALPVSRGLRWVRATMYVPASSAAAIEPSRNQALARWFAGTQVVGADPVVNFRWGTDSTFIQWRDDNPLRQDTSPPSPQVPLDRWFCFEFALDLEGRQVIASVDGSMSVSESEIADAFLGDTLYASLGVFSGAYPTTVYIDDVVIADERLPCP